MRVIRGASLDSFYAPRSGYRYDGLYLVDDYWQAEGRSGFRVWRYRLIKLPSVPMRIGAALDVSAAYPTPERRETRIQRLRVLNHLDLSTARVFVDYRSEVE